MGITKFRKLIAAPLFVLLFLSSTTFSQTTKLSLIVWSSPKTFLNPYGIKYNKILSNNSGYNAPEFDYLPVQEDNIGEVVSDFKAELINAKYQELDKDELEIVKGNKHISDKIIISTQIVEIKKKHFATVKFIPVRINPENGKYEKLISYQISYTLIDGVKRQETSNFKTYAAHSVLSSGKWYKIAIDKDGVYKISYDFLKKIGVEVDLIDPKNIRIYGNGGGMLAELNSVDRKDDLIENAIFVQGESDGKFNSNDYVLFYGKGPHTWQYQASSPCAKFHHTLNIYSDSAYYFITTDLGTGKRLQQQSSSSITSTHIVTSFDDYDYHENENKNLLKSGKLWLGEKFANTISYDIPFSFDNIDNSSSAYIKVALASDYSDGNNSINSYSVYQTSCGASSSTISIREKYSSIEAAVLGEVCYSVIPNGTLNVNVTKQTADAEGWLDYIETNVRRNLILTKGQILFRDTKSVGVGNVAKYILQSNTPVQLWDVTEPTEVKEQLFSTSNNTYEFILPSDTLKQFLAFDGSNFFTPRYCGEVANQDLHSLSKKDYVIVTHPRFLKEAQELASHHENIDGFKSAVVTVQQVYNEFSSGSQDATAIRDFMKMFYDKAGNNTVELPKYLLLFGDASYDYKNKFGSSNTNFVPSYESEISTNDYDTYVTDDFFGLLGTNEGVWNNDKIDIGIGRLPVKTETEAQQVLDKILHYQKTGFASNTGSVCSNNGNNSSFGDWRNVICLVADDEDGSDHVIQAEQLSDKIAAKRNEYNMDKIYSDAYIQEATPGGHRYPDVVEAINKRIEKGCLIFNYTGHGGEVGLAHERIVEVSHINKWNNYNKLPLFFTATCEFCRYDDPERTSAGELTLLNPHGGAIALFTTSRVVFGSDNLIINSHFYDTIFGKVNGLYQTLGDVDLYIKNQAGGNSINSRKFGLMGDPAMRLALPKYSIVTDSINSNLANTNVDTLKALSKVTVCGSVKDNNGVLLNNYNGVLYPTVYDKKQNIKTLSNDGTASPVIDFELQKNILYKGKVSVANGKFKFTFLVPKDISYKYGIGRISYYAENGTEDANGYYEKIVIGGSNDAAAVDQTGPESNVYINDEKFVFGGITDENPDLYMVVNDESGVNTVGNGIGHDITAILDGNTDDVIVLNDYYESDLNSFQSGKVRYPFNELSEGKHTLSVKVWDVYNNSSQSYTEFVVARSSELALSHVLNYPNPFTTKTQFYFEHNKCCDVLDVEVQVFTVSGKLVKTINQIISAEGNRTNPIDWDGRDEFGDKIGKGVYLYRVKVKDTNGATAEKIEKLVILN